jgi:3-keto-L-gulonate-6-phosphate decarboxylase
MFEFSATMPQNKILVDVKTTNNRGFTPEEIAKDCVAQIISVSDTAHPAIRDQARAYQKRMEQVIVDHMKQAISSDRTTVYNALIDAGHPKLAELIRRL